jgi:hypothetical protein
VRLPLILLMVFGFHIPSAAQIAPENRRVEVLVVGRTATSGALVGGQLEYAAITNVVPWVSVKYGTHQGCAVGNNSGCANAGWTIMTGARIRTVKWRSIEPYATLGLGRLVWEDGENDMTGTANIGLIWTGFGRVRPRFEAGFEGHGTGIAAGLSLIL